MIRESRVDANLNRLSMAFGIGLIIRPPASAEDVAKLEQLVGPLPREYAIFLVTCNGLRIRPAAMQNVADWHLWHAQEIVASIRHPQGPSTPPCLLPFCGDSTATRDCLATGHGPAEGAVVRWDPWAQGVELFASSFGHYLDRWADYMIGRYAQCGDNNSAKDVLPFDATCVGTGDPQLLKLRDQNGVAEWLHGLDHIIASGDDFE